jgi:hypothetical protein
VIPFTSIATSATLAPRIEIYTMLACSVHKPDLFRQNFPGIKLYPHSTIHETSGLDFRVPSSDIPTLSNIHVAHVFPGIYPFLDSSPKDDPIPPPKKGNLCTSDPVVQAAVAKLSAGEFSLCFLSLSRYIRTLKREYCIIPMLIPRLRACGSPHGLAPHTALHTYLAMSLTVSIVIATCMGILSCMTTGWWGAVSRFGGT